MSAYPSKEEAQKARLVVEGEEEVLEDEVMEDVEKEIEENEAKDEQQKHEEEEAFKKQCKTSPKKAEEKTSTEKESVGSESGGTEEAVEEETRQTVKDQTEEGEKGEEEDGESPKTGGMLLFGTLFKYMDKDKEGGGKEKSTEAKSNETPVDDGVVPVEKEDLKPRDEEEPDLTTPPPLEEMDTTPSI